MPDQDQDDAPPPNSRPGSRPDPRALARDWITVWQSELNALAVDREAAEGWARAVDLWAATATAAAAPLPGPAPHEPPGRPGAAAPAGAAAAAAAPDGRDAALERLGEQLGKQIAELERRLATMER